MPAHVRSAGPAGHAFAPGLCNATRLASVIAACVALTVAPGAAAESAIAPVYKCPQTGGSILYADYPCKGGAVVDIRPGVAAPDASERLARARDEIDRAAARRHAIDEAAALRSEELYQRQREFDAAQAFDAAEAGTVDAVGADALVGAYMLRDRPKLAFVAQIGTASPLGVGVSVAKPKLESEVRAILDRLAAEGVLSTLRRKWVGELPPLQLATGSEEASSTPSGDASSSVSTSAP
jgi:hypothetical protein